MAPGRVRGVTLTCLAQRACAGQVDSRAPHHMSIHLHTSINMLSKDKLNKGQSDRLLASWHSTYLSACLADKKQACSGLGLACDVFQQSLWKQLCPRASADGVHCGWGIATHPQPLSRRCHGVWSSCNLHIWCCRARQALASVNLLVFPLLLFLLPRLCCGVLQSRQ